MYEKAIISEFGLYFTYRFLTIVTNYGMPKTRTTSYYLKQYQTEVTRPSRHRTELTQEPTWYQAELTRFR